MVLTMGEDVQQDLTVVRKRLLSGSAAGLLLLSHLHDDICLQTLPVEYSIRPIKLRGLEQICCRCRDLDARRSHGTQLQITCSWSLRSETMPCLGH